MVVIIKSEHLVSQYVSFQSGRKLPIRGFGSNSRIILEFVSNPRICNFCSANSRYYSKLNRPFPSLLRHLIWLKSLPPIKMHILKGLSSEKGPYFLLLQICPNFVISFTNIHVRSFLPQIFPRQGG